MEYFGYPDNCGDRNCRIVDHVDNIDSGIQNCADSHCDCLDHCRGSCVG